MGAITAQILIGKKHTYDGGLVNISHELVLSEGDTPAWQLISKERSGNSSGQSQVWIPTLETMLEDGLLMAALYVLNDNELKEMAEAYMRPAVQGPIELYRNVSKDHLAAMHRYSRELDMGHKVVLTVMDGSTVTSQIHVLKEYAMDAEVCMPAFKRELNLWTGQHGKAEFSTGKVFFRSPMCLLGETRDY